ncbi:heme-binding protein [Phenylobacterium sp.]|uniref:SOUL family heme-binding protein n=1 Tax=Phenylobacterium sp. TaxID=1871053 RepID=UPI0025ED0E66|nr:heme-binding protein [Phenylobacterium sp.]
MAGVGEILLLIFEGVGQTFGLRAGTEQPRYTVVEQVGSVEIRRYAPRIAAETTVTGPEEAARNAGFRRVAAYIFGANQAKAGVAMTAPVAQGRAAETIAMTSPVAQANAGADGWVVQFFMPAKYTLATLPTPSDPSVRLTALPAQDFAVLRFTGARGPKAVGTQSRTLQAALSASLWRATARPTAWFYDPPWTLPLLRRNEVAAPVTKAGPASPHR